MIAALAFFGVAGLATQSAGASDMVAVGVALAAGFGAMYAVYWIMRSLYRMQADGTVRIRNAIGMQATVYLRIPPAGHGPGKIHINLQNRTMEYSAVTTGDGIPTGARVVVVDVVSPDTLEVEPALEAERIENV
jgi:threonine/homoserine efflux transporter RhtA